MNHDEHNQMKMYSPRRARELNSYNNLESRMESSGKVRLPNLFAVEFWDEGEVLDFVKIKNSGKNREGGEYETSGASRNIGEMVWRMSREAWARKIQVEEDFVVGGR